MRIDAITSGMPGATPTTSSATSIHHSERCRLPLVILNVKRRATPSTATVLTRNTCLPNARRAMAWRSKILRRPRYSATPATMLPMLISSGVLTPCHSARL